MTSETLRGLIADPVSLMQTPTGRATGRAHGKSLILRTTFYGMSLKKRLFESMKSD
jgi:hypothetical protein